MSQIRISSLVIGLLLLLSLVVLSGCGDKNSQVNLNPVTGNHPSTWLPSGHATAAKDNIEGCTQCHGSDFGGGISKVACLQCHLGNERSPHPVFWNYTSTKPTAWGTFAYAFHGKFAKENTTKSCAVASCHGTALDGLNGSGPSCMSCHMGDNSTVHPLTWIPKFTDVRPGRNIYPTNLPDHGAYVNTNDASKCTTSVCHGVGGVGVFLSGRACRACHV
jgi:hypothetical protein